MLMRDALRNRSISRLWLGQAMSSIGDEIYRVGLTWLAVGLIGVDTGYLTAAEAAALMVLSFVGGRWADGWEPLRTMVRVDLVRAAIVLIPVVVSFFRPVPLAVLVPVALTLSALGAFFDPAMQATLPHFAPDLTLRRAATGLMSTTFRMARLVGPSLVALLSGWIPMIHFFTLDALSFLVSALSVRSLRDPGPPRAARSTDVERSFAAAIAADFRTVRAHPDMSYVMWARAITGGTWTLTVALGLALLARQLAPHDARVYGLLLASYGAGNITGALYFGNHHRPRPAFLMGTGYAGMGVGFILIASAPTMHWMMVAAVLSGFTGPMNDLAFADIVQARFSVAELPRVFRLRMAVETLSTLLCTGVSPFLFRALTVRGTVAVCGVAWVAAGVYGLLQLTEVVTPETPGAAPSSAEER